MLAFTSLPSSHPSFYNQSTTQSRSISHLLTNHQPPTSLSLSSTNKPIDTKSGAAYHASVNQQIVQKRNTISRLKKEAKQKVVDNDRQRNLRLRTLFLEENSNSTDQSGVESSGNEGSNGGNRAPPPMFAVKVVTCPTLRSELKMNGREKRGRMFVERSPSLLSTLEEDNGEGEEGKNDEVEYACTSLKTLRQTIHEFFRRLKKSTYILSASLPTFDVDGNVLTHSYDSDDEQHDNMGTWTLESDVDVQKAFIQAETFYNESSIENQMMKRPTLILHVTKDPNAPKPPPLPTYLQNMSNPQDSTTMTMLSFYSFPPQGISNPEDTAIQLKRLWKPFKVLGRVYVAQEGINAQMAIPTNVLSNFLNCCTLSPSQGGSILSEVLGSYIENGLNIDPIPITIQEFEEEKPFKRLHIRVRSQIVADGLEDPLDWQNAGYDMPAIEWHEKLKLARESSSSTTSSDDDSKDSTSNDLPIVLDCRNSYETQVGKFELAEPLNTTNFRDSWDVLQNRLKDVPKDAPIMTYCTGGIRCVKVASYLTQEMGYTNVSRLAGGVVAYDRTINEQVPDDEPMFKGVNYVFDGRMGRRITNDQLGNCYTCGRKTHLVSNCNNDNCHKRMVQCEYCSETFFGTCSEGCKTRVVNSGMMPKRRSSSDENDEEVKEDSTPTNKETVYTNLDDYSSAHSTSPQPLLTQIESNTHKFLPTGAHMVSGQMQGSLLTTLASQSREGRILEIGTFTGYATACFLKGAAAAGRYLNNDNVGTREGGGPFVLSLERDRRALGLASAHLNVMTEHGIGKKGAQEASKLYDQDSVPDFEEESASFVYNDIAGCELLRVNDALATVEELAMHNPTNAAYDIVFVDADKTRLYEYVNALVSNDRVLKKGGLILVDNVLWKGLVLDASIGYDSDDETIGVETSQDKELLKKNRRARKLANKMHRFNSEVVKDDRVDVLLMNLRDGLSMIRKR